MGDENEINDHEADSIDNSPPPAPSNPNFKSTINDELYEDEHERQLTRKIWADLTITELCAEARKGKYIDVEKLNSIDFSKKIKPEWVERADSIREIYKTDIESYGEESLAHLCLSLTELLDLRKSGILAISQLQQAIEQEKLRIGYDSQAPNHYQKNNFYERRVKQLYIGWSKIIS